MSVTVLDSNNLEAILADAGYEPEPHVANLGGNEEVVEQQAEGEPEEKPEAKTDEAEDHPDDDKEGPDGLSPREKRELSAKMLKAVGKRVAQRRAAEEFADAQYKEKLAAERRAEDLERQINELKGTTQAETPPDGGKPDRANFGTDLDYIEALTDWKTDQKFAQKEAERLDGEARSRLSAQIAKAKDLVEDFEDVTGASSMQVPQNVTAYMRESDLFAELGYHFAKNPDVLKRLQSFSPVKQLVELGKIEATLAPFGSRTSEPKAGATPTTDGKPSKAAPSNLNTGFSPSKARSDAPVIRPLTSGEGSQVEPEARDMNTREMIQAWQRTNKTNLNLRKRH